MGSNLNFADMWGRVYLARLCSALIFAEWTSTQTFVEGLGAPFLKMLAALATRQAFEACAAPLSWGRCSLLQPPASQSCTSCSWSPGHQAEARATGAAATSLLPCAPLFNASWRLLA